ncbi:unnamed protein product [Cuscuta campestris]|uniref:Uncharacterized protein n=1 Tax=Cuscuta campestris TaxID=132261 RepID=A0A484MFS7_9ASTE|nr:unnamed protein product [Cuscuta campestris]
MPPPPVAAELSIVVANDDDDRSWAERLLRDCVCAISEKDSAKTHHLLWMLNELASPYGDANERLAAHFLRALFCKATQTGPRVYRTLVSVSTKAHTFDFARKVMLKFQEVSPWTTFGHVAANGAILEATDGAAKLHIIDVSNTLCTQWPTLLEALATRHDDTPHLKLTVVATTASSATVKSLKNEIAQRLEKFARLMGVPFEFNVVTELTRLGEITKEILNVRDDESVAVNVVGALRRARQRAEALRAIRSLNPKIVTVVEEEAAEAAGNGGGDFEECLGFYRRYFGMLEESFPATSNERLALEREGSRSILRAVGFDDMAEEDGGGECERRERGGRWSGRFREAGFTAVALSDETVDDVKALLKRYKGGWGAHRDPQHDDDVMMNSPSSSSSSPGIFLTWKDEPVVWASAWKP